jgi:hypothetical protein
MTKERRIHLTVTEREFDTIIAALRLWQTDGAHIADGDGSIIKLAEEHGQSLSNAEVDELIERIN